MKLFEAVQAALSNLQQAQDLQCVHRACAGLAAALDYQYFIYAFRALEQFNQPRVVYVNGYPPGWTERYFDRKYQNVDPVMLHCRQRLTPVVWADLVVSSPESVAMMADAVAFGLTDGVTVPVHTPTGQMGVFSLAAARASADAPALSEVRCATLVMAPYIHEAIDRLAPSAGEALIQTLTEREAECLRWAADGKTSWEIGQLLGVTERTANHHLNNAVFKLGANNRQHAVAKAVVRGIVKPQPF